MKYRRFGRTGWEVSEMGYGMWGMASWANSSDDESLRSLHRLCWRAADERGGSAAMHSLATTDVDVLAVRAAVPVDDRAIAG